MTKRFIPLCLLLTLMAIAYFSDIFHDVSWKGLQEKDIVLKRYVDQHFALASIFFIFVYTLYSALSLPAVFILSILAGYLFEQPLSTLYVCVSATIGSSLLFLAVRTAFGDALKRKAAPFLDRMKEHFFRHELRYLFFVRLVPLFPFWLVNIASAMFNVRLWSFLWTTFLGFIPVSFLFTQIGSGLTTILNQNIPLTFKVLLIPKIGFSLIGLALFCALPFWFRQLKGAD